MTIHGHNRVGKRTATYRAWAHMISRCYDLKDPRNSRYAGRGVKVVQRWWKFENFLADMGEKPVGLTLERKDNDQGYSPENCVWATWEEQRQNKSLYDNNTSGLKGVHFCQTQKVWVARSGGGKRRNQLYKGLDFFEACCARKSWEAEAARLQALK